MAGKAQMTGRHSGEMLRYKNKKGAARHPF